MAILGLSTRATNALDRVGVTTVRQLLDLPVGDVRFMRGVGKKTRDEIIAALDHLRKRFPKPPDGGRPEGRLDARTRGPGDARPRRPATQAARRGAGLEGRQGGEDPRAVPGPLRRRGDWPSQAEVSARLDVTRQRIGQVVGADRERWAREPAVTALRAELLRTVQAAGGVMALPELADALAAARGTAVEAPDDRRRLAAALVRLAFEAEQGMAEPPPAPAAGRAGSLLLACTPELADYAERLGRVADAMAGENPLPPPLRVFQRLYEVAQPEFPPECAAAEQRADHPPGRRRQRPRRRVVPAGTLPPRTWTPAAPCTSAWGR